MIYIGAASWRLPKPVQVEFPGPGTHLERYARRVGAVELNSSFYRRHRRSQYAKWASEVPEAFRFAVKMPRWLSHHQRLRDTEGLREFLEEIEGLGEKLGPVLIQLPPSLAFEADNVTAFLSALRQRLGSSIVLEPRHTSWFAEEADEVLSRHGVSRVGADPAPAEGADIPTGWSGIIYVRLHGNPKRFYSSYSDAYLDDMAARLRAWSARAQVWCIFNNTATEAGINNALQLQQRLC